MGSLVPGWDSFISDHMTAEMEKNKSMTKEEIETYWRAKKKAGSDEHVSLVKGCEENVRSTNSSPLACIRDEMQLATETSLEKFMKENGWWALTNSAFLNDPPVIAEEGPKHNYVSQFHVASNIAPKPQTKSEISK